MSRPDDFRHRDDFLIDRPESPSPQTAALTADELIEAWSALDDAMATYYDLIGQQWNLS